MKKTSYTGERFVPNETSGEMVIEHIQRYQLACEFVKNKVVLDAACGDGYGTNILSDYVKEIVGIDIDKEVIDTAKEKYNKKNISFKCASIEQLPFEDDTFDVIISFETLEHVNEEIQRKFLKEIKRVLKEDGCLIISTPNKYIYTDIVETKNQFHIKEFYYDDFEEFLRKEFANIHFYYQMPILGYYLCDTEEESFDMPFISKDIARYYIAVCSMNEIENCKFRNVKYDTSMYYFLCKYSNQLEKKIIEMKQEVDKFNSQQDNVINEQKGYISHLEKDLVIVKDELTRENEKLTRENEKLVVDWNRLRSLNEDFKKKNIFKKIIAISKFLKNGSKIL